MRAHADVAAMVAEAQLLKRARLEARFDLQREERVARAPVASLLPAPEPAEQARSLVDVGFAVEERQRTRLRDEERRRTDVLLAITAGQARNANLLRNRDADALRQVVAARAHAQVACARVERERDAWRREALAARAAAALAASVAGEDADGCLRELRLADKDGLLEGETFLQELFRSIGESLRGKQVKNKTKKSQVAFYNKLATKGGPALVNFVSGLLHGPSGDRVRAWRRDAFKPKPGNTSEAIDYNVDNAVKLLERDGFDCAKEPVFVAEDGTSFQVHLDATLRGDEVYVYGIAGGPYKIESRDDMLRLLAKHGFSTTLYTHVLIPNRRTMRAIPIVFQESNNRFTRGDVHETLRRILTSWAARTHAPTLLAGFADGDSRLRKESLSLLHPRIPVPGMARITHDHFLLRGFGIPSVTDYGFFFVLAGEYMHTAWRTRVQYLYVHRHLALGPFLLFPSAFEKAAKRFNAKLSAKHFDPSNKQAWTETQALYGLDDAGAAVEESYLDRMWNDASCAEVRADVLYLRTMGRFVSVYTDKTMPFFERCRRCAYVIGFLIYTYESTRRSPTLSVKENWLTQETATDIILNCVTLPLYGMTLATAFPEAAILPERLGSRFCEYLYQTIRAMDRNGSKFTSFTALTQLVRKAIHEVDLDSAASFAEMTGKRTAPTTCTGKAADAPVCDDGPKLTLSEMRDGIDKSFDAGLEDVQRDLDAVSPSFPLFSRLPATARDLSLGRKSVLERFLSKTSTYSSQKVTAAEMTLEER